jgi:hypothetical protein
MVGRSNRRHDERLGRTVIVTLFWSCSSSHDTGEAVRTTSEPRPCRSKDPPGCIASRPGQDLVVISEDAPDFRQHVGKWGRFALSN